MSNLNTYDETVIYGDVFFEIYEPGDLEYTYRLRPAKDFGTAFNKDRFNAKENYMVLAKPREACDTLENAAELNGNVAFVERGDCSFVTKALIAEMAGARAVIITDTTDDDFYIEMVHDNSTNDVNIPVAYLLGRNGKMIIGTLEKYGLDRAVINIPLNLTFTPPEQINHPPWAMT